jgi:hypothetical protein
MGFRCQVDSAKGESASPKLVIQFIELDDPAYFGRDPSGKGIPEKLPCRRGVEEKEAQGQNGHQPKDPLPTSPTHGKKISSLDQTPGPFPWKDQNGMPLF